MSGQGEMVEPGCGPWGYRCGRGGIGNQKYTLLGLFRHAHLGRDTGANRIVLPGMAIYDQGVNFGPGSQVPAILPLGEVYWPDMVADFASRHGIEIVSGTPPDAETWDYFTQGGHLPQAAHLEGGQEGGDFAVDFFRSLIPRIRNAALFADLHRAAFRERGVRLAVQMRIEADWRVFGDAFLHEAVGPSEAHSPSALAIMAKIKGSLPDLGPAVYVVCDEAHLPAPKEEIRDEIRRRIGVELVWKSDLIAPDLFAALNPLDLSLLDFEIALEAEAFVGNTRSTFSNLVTFERYSRTRRPVTTHYLYNVPDLHLRARTDNGACYTAEQATAGSPLLMVERPARPTWRRALRGLLRPRRARAAA